MQYTLPKSNILRGYQSFSRIIGKGTSVQQTLLTGYVSAHPGMKPDAVIGFTVSKKKTPLAVHRNRIKRLMREAVRRHFYQIREKAAQKKLNIEIVVSYRGNRNTDVRRLSLLQIEPEWMLIQQRILEML